MAFTYQISDVLDMFRQFTLDDLTTQGEVPSGLPFLFVANQYEISAADLPLTAIEVKDIKFDRTQAVNSVEITIPVVLHHVRQRDGMGNADVVAIQRLAHIGASIEEDHRLGQEDADIQVDKCIAHMMQVGNDVPIQLQINESDQQTAMCCVSMPIEICWTEYKN